MRLINALLLALVLTSKLVAQAQFPSSITLGAAPPTGVRAINASVTGPTGFANYFYWVIANFPGGKADANSNAQISNAPNVLSGTNFVTVSWTPVNGATNYDVIKSTGNAFPGSCNSCAIAIGVAGPTFNDIGGVGLFYTYSPVIPNATATISLDNAGYTIPRLLENRPVNITLFANLPPASQHNQEVWIIWDAATSSTCTSDSGVNNPAICISNGSGWIPLGGSGGGGMIFPPAGIPVSTGTSWSSSKNVPVGNLVGDTDVQTLTNKTVDGVTPATFAFVDPTSSIQTQLNGKQANLPTGTVDQYINGTLTLSTIVNCVSAGGVLQYSTTTHLWTCHTLVGTDLPNPAVGSKGGVNAINCSAGSQFVQSINTDGSVTCATPVAGNVTGPASSTTGDLASFTDTTGKLIQDSGVATTNVNTLSGNQTVTGNKTFTGTTNASGAAHTLPMKTGLTSAAPATCTVGEMYFATDGPAGANELYCTATNVFSSEKIVTTPTNRVANQFMTSLSGANPSVFGFSAIVAADLPAALTNTSSVNGTAIPGSATLTQTISTGTIVVPVTAVGANTCDAAATTLTATGATVATDTWSATPTTDPTAATGYNGGTNGGITIWLWLTANTVNLKRCNQTGASITPGTLSLLVKVLR